MAARLTSWTSSGFFLEIICVEEGEDSRELFLPKRCRGWFFSRGWHKYKQGHSSECDNECII